MDELRNSLQHFTAQQESKQTLKRGAPHRYVILEQVREDSSLPILDYTRHRESIASFKTVCRNGLWTDIPCVVFHTSGSATGLGRIITPQADLYLIRIQDLKPTVEMMFQTFSEVRTKKHPFRHIESHHALSFVHTYRHRHWHRQTKILGSTAAHWGVHT